MPRGPLSLLLVLGLCLFAPAALARAADADACADAIRAIERSAALPRGLLAAVSFAEAGRRDPDGKRAVAWPWTVNNGGDGRYFASKAEAMAHVEALRAQGKRNIDVGCMQINLMHHPDAFASLESAFEPTTNVAYGARFLQGLQRETGSWARAIERYHTADPARGEAYRERVQDRWQNLQLADLGGSSARPGRRADRLSSRRLEPAARAEGRPREVPRRGQLAALSNRGFLRLTPEPAKVAVLGPQRGRPVVGMIRADGRIAGSGLRVGPRRSGLGGTPPRGQATVAPPAQSSAEAG